jgi:hypothetical protein
VTATAVVELAISAEVRSVSFMEVLLTGDRALVPSFLERGADAINDHPFARASHQPQCVPSVSGPDAQLAGAEGESRISAENSRSAHRQAPVSECDLAKIVHWRPKSRVADFR